MVLPRRTEGGGTATGSVFVVEAADNAPKAVDICRSHTGGNKLHTAGLLRGRFGCI